MVARSAEPLQKLKAEYPKQVEVLNGDLADLSLGQKAVDLALKSFGRVDGLVLNHGALGQVENIAVADIEQWKHGFDVNFFSLVAFVSYPTESPSTALVLIGIFQVKAALPALRESKGRIVFTSSGASVSAYKGWGLYGSSKAAMNHLALTLGAEEPEVTSLAIEPGIVDTEMQREIREDRVTTMDAQFHSFFTSAHKSGGLLSPEQPGHVIAKAVIGAESSLSGKYLS